MTSRGEEIRHGLSAASKAVRFQRDALPVFNDSNRAVLISFWALPLFVGLHVMTSVFAGEILTAASTIEGVTEVAKERPAGEMTPVIAVLSLIVRWLFPLVIAYEMARGMAVTRAWPRYVVAANWCAVLQVLPITIGAVVMQLVGAPPRSVASTIVCDDDLGHRRRLVCRQMGAWYHRQTSDRVAYHDVGE